ncbi:MAG: hypothetical protein MPL62_15565, partial [Alphaproteobacteria bacterium]|nr:hypothetical protein [Alphaproteobacteria bacterium]
WAQLEEAASCAQVVKVKVDVEYSARASRALAAGFSRNSVLREVRLIRVPVELVQSVRETLCTNAALTVTVR